MLLKFLFVKTALMRVYNIMCVCVCVTNYFIILVVNVSVTVSHTCETGFIDFLARFTEQGGEVFLI